MSLEEGRVLIWKTSSGFSAFFSPGQMPRQGATDVKLTVGAYKAFLFNVGDQQQTANRIAQTGQYQERIRNRTLWASTGLVFSGTRNAASRFRLARRSSTSVSTESKAQDNTQ